MALNNHAVDEDYGQLDTCKQSGLGGRRGMLPESGWYGENIRVFQHQLKHTVKVSVGLN